LLVLPVGLNKQFPSAVMGSNVLGRPEQSCSVPWWRSRLHHGVPSLSLTLSHTHTHTHSSPLQSWAVIFLAGQSNLAVFLGGGPDCIMGSRLSLLLSHTHTHTHTH